MSKKKTLKDLPKYSIVRDTREKDGNGWMFNATSNCHGTVTKKLETGDYSIEGMEHLISIERKSIGDLWGTLIQGRERFLRELERMKDIPYRYIIIEGSLKDVYNGCYFSKVPPEFIVASLTSIEQDYGIHIIYADKRKDVCQWYVRRLLEKLYKKQHNIKETDGRPEDTDGAKTSD